MSPSKELKDPKDAKDPKADSKSAGKPRIYALAAELNLDTKAILEYCKELGYSSVKNQLSALENDQADAIRDRAKRGPKTSSPSPVPAAASPAKTAAPPKLDAKIPTIAKPKTIPATPAKPTAKAPTPAAPVEPAVPPPAPVPVVAEVPVVETKPQPAAKPAPSEPVVVPKPPVKPVKPVVDEVPPSPPRVEETRPVKVVPAIPETPVAPPVVAVAPPVIEPKTVVAENMPAPVELPDEVAPDAEVEVVSEPIPEPAAPVAPALPNLPPNRMPNLSGKPPMLGNRPPNLAGNRPTIVPPRPNQPPRPAPVAPGAAPPPRPAPGPNAGPASPGTGHPPRPSAPGQPGFPPRPGPGMGSASGPGGSPRPGMGNPPRVPGPQGGPNRPYTGGPGGAPPRGPNTGGPGGAPPRGPNTGGPPGGPSQAGGKPQPANANKQVKLTPEQIQKMRLMEQQRGVRLTMDQVQKQITAPPPDKARPDEPAAPGAARPDNKGRPGKPGGTEEAEDAERRGGGAGDKRRPGGVIGREDRQAKRQDKGRQRGPTTDKGSVIIDAGGRVDIIEEQRGQRMKRRPGKGQDKHVRKTFSGRIEIMLPITVRTLSETIGMKAGEVILKLKNLTNSLYTINSNIDFEVAEMIAIEKQIELVAKKQETTEDKALRELEERALKSDVANQVLRPPIVTIMGHVDHGKTSLLDKIRQTYGLSSDVVSTEAGGITQVLRAWRVEKDGKSTTFLDTPGHEAFTKMRARGAKVTDIAVIVVSASDGVMPQTEEAVAHAKAAEVDIIVAINKVDLPDANIEKTRRQLYQLNLLPDNMGGEVPFVECSAKTGKGIDELLDNIATLAEFADLKADPTIAGSGTCLEGYLEGEKGVVATLMVQNGTLRKGDTVLCGSTYGRVRAMYSDLGRQIEEAGPSTPVKIIGLSEVPDADDPFFVVDDVSTAREIADKRREAKLEASLSKFSPVSLDKLKEATAKIKITELKVILKAEARGSVEAIKKELEKLVHEEVRVRVLHSGIGAINESDVTLALTSPADTMIVGFNVTADDAALKLCEARDISIREYQIIYNLVDDVKAALEGRLKPTEEVIHLGRAVVRETFKISKVGTVAGCHVTSGVLERSARVRVIREGTVIFPPAEKHIGLDNLKRFKDDVKEVREGFECGLKISGFDDIKVGDVIEAFKIEIRYRKL